MNFKMNILITVHKSEKKLNNYQKFRKSIMKDLFLIVIVINLKKVSKIKKVLVVMIKKINNKN